MAISSADKQRAYRERQRQKLLELSSASNVTNSGNVTDIEILTEARRILSDSGCNELKAQEKKQLAGHLLADWFPEYLDINILGVLHMYIIK
jgi:hypothetical protein